MTLTISFATRRALYQSSDFRLTDPSDLSTLPARGHKSIQVTQFDWSALIAFSGVARTRTVDVSAWLGALAADLPKDASLGDLLDRLLTADSWLAPVAKRNRAFTLSVLAFEGQAPSMAIVSNIDRLDRPREPEAADRLHVQRARPRGPKVFVTGVPNPFPRSERRALERHWHEPPDQVSKRIAHLNEVASAALGGRYISPSCLVSYLEPSGRGVSVPFGIDAEAEEFMPADIAAMFERQGVDLRPRLGPNGEPMPIKLVQMTTQRTGQQSMMLMELQAQIDDSPQPADRPDESHSATLAKDR